VARYEDKSKGVVYMKKRAVYPDFDEYLKEQLKDAEFRQAYEEELNNLRVGYAIARMRGKLGITQGELAKRAKTTQPVISRIEKGGDVKVSTLTSLASAMGVEMEFKLKKPYLKRSRARRKIGIKKSKSS
jgi:ribosome-binding protein aMBF1 (putative translation factor)